MNYRHAYHAGNFGDVLKHVVLTLVMRHLLLKETPIRVIDLHAGVGLYDLNSIESGKTGEWRDGIGKLLPAQKETDKGEGAENTLSTYLDIVRSMNDGGGLSQYPGSPMIARALMRDCDVLVANELHEEDNKLLSSRFKRDDQVRVLKLDAWTAIKSLLPPRERRGLVLIDPPFEDPHEFDRMVEGMVEAQKRFETGVYILWYPIKDRKPLDRFYRRLADALSRPALVCELLLQRANNPNRLNGSGVVVVNPPYTLSESLSEALPFLKSRITSNAAASTRLEMLSDATVRPAQVKSAMSSLRRRGRKR